MKLVKINIDLISHVKNIQFLTAFRCIFFFHVAADATTGSSELL